MKKILMTAMVACLSASAFAQTTLKDAYADKFLIGTVLNTWQIDGQQPMALEVAAKNFNSVVAENCMKAEVLQPAENEFRFNDADQLVNFGLKNNMVVIGHCLVWHSQAPRWFFTNKHGGQVSREELIERLRNHIYTVVGRYKGRVKGWDVVNEAIEGDGSYRKSPYYNIIGKDFIPLAFKFAHEADPEAELYYNDYGMDSPAKRAAVVQLVKELKEAGCRIDAVGMQSHVAFDTNLTEYEKSMEAFAASGVKVQVTELDLSVLPWPRHGMGAAVEENYAYKQSLDPYKEGMPKDMVKKQTDFFSQLFDIYLRHADDLKRVTFWGLSDGDSWKNNWPVPGRTDYPLAFDRQYKPKPFVDVLIKKVK